MIFLDVRDIVVQVANPLVSIVIALGLHVDKNPIELVLQGFLHHGIDIHLGQFVEILDRLLNDTNRLFHIHAEHVQVDAAQTALHNVRRDIGHHFC